MAVNVSVFDLVNYPSNPKTVTVDLSEVVPYGNSGEDTWVLSAITTATASGGASIQRLYISDTKFGWAKSSGLQSGPYTVSDSQKHLKVAIDEDIAEAEEILLDTNILPLGGDAVALDIQTKLNAAASAGGNKVGNLSYLNAVCTYTNGVFQVVSGSAGSLYTGTDRTSVAVSDGVSTTGLAASLGFDVPFTSEVLSAVQVTQTSLSVDYTSGTSLTVANSDVISSGDCLMITDGTNKEYRGVEYAGAATVTLSSGLGSSYLTGTLVQVLSEKDPSGEPAPAYSQIDDYIKFAIASIANQINFAA